MNLESITHNSLGIYPIVRLVTKCNAIKKPWFGLNQLCAHCLTLFLFETASPQYFFITAKMWKSHGHRPMRLSTFPAYWVGTPFSVPIHATFPSDKQPSNCLLYSLILYKDIQCSPKNLFHS